MFSSNKNLKYHSENNSCKVYDFECKYCRKQFTTSTSMHRHVRLSCNVKKEEDSKKDKIYERLLELEKKSEKIDVLEKENTLLKMKVTAMEKKSRVVKNIHNGEMNINQGTINNTTNQIVLVGYGQEDLSKLGKNELIKIFQNGYNSTLKLTEAVHFNPKYPEHHNIYISNIKDKYAMMFDGKKWTLTMKDDLINKIYDDKKNYIEENLEDFLDSLSTSRKKALDRWLETDEENAKISKIKNEIKLLLYNKRDLITYKYEESIQGSKKPINPIKESTKKAYVKG
jgi:hypothetical protein